MKAVEQKLTPLHDLSQKLIRYAQNLAQCTGSAIKAAVAAGYTYKTAHGQCWRWIGKTRQESEYPALWDYYQQLRAERLRQYDLTQDTIANELRICAFSSIENYLDLPSLEVHNKINKLDKRITKLVKEADKNTIVDAIGFGKDGAPEVTRKYNEKGTRIIAKVEKLAKKSDELKAGPGYRLRLKFREEIPAELMPAIAEIKETREGVSIKLHNKLESLDKLARFLRMYDQERDQDKPAVIKELNMIVNGSRSKLLDDEDQAAA